MPRLTITADEIIDFVKQYEYLPDSIKEIRIEGDTLHLQVNVIGSFHTDVSITFTGYTDGLLTVIIHTAGWTGTLAKGLSRLITREDGFDLNWPQVRMNLNQLLRKYAGNVLPQDANVMITALEYRNSKFIIDFTV